MKDEDAKKLVKSETVMMGVKTFDNGAKVQIYDLAGATTAHLNDKTAVVKGYRADIDRYNVQVESGEYYLLKVDNLREPVVRFEKDTRVEIVGLKGNA